IVTNHTHLHGTSIIATVYSATRKMKLNLIPVGKRLFTQTSLERNTTSNFHTSFSIIILTLYMVRMKNSARSNTVQLCYSYLKVCYSMLSNHIRQVHIELVG